MSNESLLVQIAEDVAAVRMTLYGVGTTEGLVSKVDRIDKALAVQVPSKKNTSKVAGVAATVVSVIVSGTVAALTALGIVPTK